MDQARYLRFFVLILGGGLVIYNLLLMWATLVSKTLKGSGKRFLVVVIPHSG